MLPDSLNIKNRIRSVSLLEDVLTSLKFQDRFASPYLDEKGFGIKSVVGCIAHRSLPFFAPMNARASHYSGCSAMSHSSLKSFAGWRASGAENHAQVCAGQIITLHLCSIQMERTRL